MIVCTADFVVFPLSLHAPSRSPNAVKLFSAAARFADPVIEIYSN